MTWAVAWRFGFGEREMLDMPLSRLQFWYDGAMALADEERKAIDGSTES